MRTAALAVAGSNNNRVMAQASDPPPTEGFPLLNLDDGHGATLQLSVLDYQYPELTAGMHEYDSDWLRILIKGTTAAGDQWQVVDPCLQTTELDAIHAWLTHAVESGAAGQAPDFIEPELRFELHKEDHVWLLNVLLSHAAAPPALHTGSGLELHFYISDEKIKEIQSNIHLILQQYPGHSLGHESLSQAATPARQGGTFANPIALKADQRARGLKALSMDGPRATEALEGESTDAEPEK